MVWLSHLTTGKTVALAIQTFVGKVMSLLFNALTFNSMTNRWGKNGSSDRFYSLDSKITADGDYSHEIKRCLLLGRKAMTNLDSISKSRDIILPAKVCVVKAMVFPLVVYRCECWTIKKAEC